jgi:hypothetical protein
MRRWIFRSPAGVTTAPADGPTDRHDTAYVADGVLEGPRGDG